MTKQTLSYGVLPSQDNFSTEFNSQIFGLYEIRHGTKAQEGEERPDAGDYTERALWAELQRLVTLDTESSLSWASDILSTLGFEWI